MKKKTQPANQIKKEKTQNQPRALLRDSQIVFLYEGKNSKGGSKLKSHHCLAAEE